MARRNSSNPRALACKILRQLHQHGGFSNRLLAQGLESQSDLSRSDRGLVTNLVYGVLRHRGRLDYLIDRAAAHPERLNHAIRNILRVAVYEYLELDHPLSVASSQANTLTRKLDPSGKLGRLCTAITAEIDRKLESWEGDVGVAVDKATLINRWSIPAWMADRWLDQLGPQKALHRAQALSKTPFIDLRLDLSRCEPSKIINQLAEDHPGIVASVLPDHPQCLRVRSGGDLFYGPLYQTGVISIQSLGSQQAAIVLDPQPGEHILDACTGMGTKLLQLAELMQRRGSLVACDIDGRRMQAITELRQRGQLDHDSLALVCVVADLTGPHPELSSGFDGILLDAPCSGLGNLARHPELRYSTSQSDSDRCATRQSDLIRQCLTLLRPGGRLVYAVCSLEPEESTAQIASICQNPMINCEVETSMTPEAHSSDGFYAARLRLGQER